MQRDAIAIEELVLRVPGVRREEAPALVDDVLRRVHEHLRGTGQIGRAHLAHLTVKVPAGARRDQLVDAIAGALTEALR